MTHQMPLLHSGTQRNHKDFSSDSCHQMPFWCGIRCKTFLEDYGCGCVWAVPDLGSLTSAPSAPRFGPALSEALFRHFSWPGLRHFFWLFSESLASGIPDFGIPGFGISVSGRVPVWGFPNLRNPCLRNPCFRNSHLRNRSWMSAPKCLP